MGNQAAAMCLGKQKPPPPTPYTQTLRLPDQIQEPFGIKDQQSQKLLNQNLYQILSKRTNLFEGIIAPYRSQPKNQWVPVGENLIYKGEWNKQGNRHGHGFLYDRKEESLIIGCFSDNNLISNKCRKIFSNGTQYIGQLNQEYQMHGRGQVIGKKFTYQGQLKNNKFDGQGQLDREGITFKGDFEKGLKKKGIQITKEGTYEGPFEKQQREGKGIFIWNDGGKFQGTFSKNKMHGKGKLYDREGNFSGAHTFEDGKLLI